MTITARQTSTRIHAIRTLVDKLATLPLAVGEIHRAIDLGTINDTDRPRAEDAGVRSRGGISDPTGEKACGNVTAYERHLDDVEANLAALALAAGNLCDVVSRWVRSAANVEDHPRCNGGRGNGVEPWTDPTCGEYVSYRVRDDGSLSYRSDGLCDACRMRRHRWLKQADDAA
jgi:hypothetical protein